MVLIRLIVLKMPIGDILKFNISDKDDFLKRLFKKWYFTIFGTPDLHTQIRWREIRIHIFKKKYSYFLDVGCGAGLMTIEIARRNPLGKVIGIDTDEIALQNGNILKNRLGIKNIKFYHINAMDSWPFQNNFFDIVLLADIIEHLEKPESLFMNVSRVTKKGGSIIISVPTPNYPRYFGQKFHNEIGHVVDGYYIEEIAKIISHYNFEIIEYRYYTNIPSSIMCFLFYRFLRKHKVGIFFSPFLNLISYLDYMWLLKHRIISCSLLVRAEKKN